MTAIHDIIAERRRQVELEGWSAEHDDLHDCNELSRAAACYARYSGMNHQSPPKEWPWDAIWWKPTNQRRNLIKAAALIVAEIERCDRRAAHDRATCSDREGNIHRLGGADRPL